MRTVIITLSLALLSVGSASAQCGKLVRNPVTGKMDCTGPGPFQSASGNVTIGATVLDPVNGVRGPKVPNVQSGTSYTIQSTDCGRILKFTAATAVALTVPTALGDGCFIAIVQAGAGQITPTASGTTLIQRDSLTKTDGQYAVAALVWFATDTYILSGDLQ